MPSDTLAVSPQRNSAQKNQVQQLTKEKEQLEIALAALIANLPGHVYWKDVDGRYLGCNDGQAKSLGFNYGDETVGLTDFDLPWKPGQAAEFRKNDLEVMQTGTMKVVEEPAVFNGKEAIVLSQKVPLKNRRNEVVGVLGISTDITELKNKEKLALSESVAHAKARCHEEETRHAVMILAGSVVHDLRTPLFTISTLGFLIKNHLPTLIESYQLAIDANLPISNPIKPDFLAELQVIPKALDETVKHMNTFINDTLKALSRVVSGTLTPEDLVPCSINHCIHNILERYPFEKNERELIQRITRYDFDFLGNPVLFFRILFNLIKNSLYQIHKNNKGEIFIYSEDGGDANILRFKDTAGGISLEDSAKLFDGFRTTKKDGTGVGLAFCKLTMQSFGGDITCNTVEGDYIEFILSFPKIKTS